VKVGVCGLGRIGRTFLRATAQRATTFFDVAAAADLATHEQVSYLLEHDSIRGLSRDVQTTKEGFLLGKWPVTFVSGSSVPDWKELEVDVVLEATGRHESRVYRAHLEAGAKCVLVSAPAEEVDATIVFGYNHEMLQGTEKAISAASCTTNCLVPMVTVLDSLAGIEAGLMSTVHSYTADQRLVDAAHVDLRRSRAAAWNIVPTTTGAARATGRVVQDMNDRLDGRSFRVPVPDVSLVDLTVLVKRAVGVEEIAEAFEIEAGKSLIMEAKSAPIVSTDILGSSASCTVDLEMTIVIGRLVKVVGWYDNEWGYANRLADLLDYMGRMGRDARSAWRSG
jgi:glyceraldehyde 3-phosphate dehydrogenase